MHTEYPPYERMQEWLEEYLSINDNFGHLLLVQNDIDQEEVASFLRPYFESAHLDAREVFHSDIGIDLHPDAGDGDTPLPTYPNSLPSRTQRGLFGEVITGLVVENYELVGKHDWVVPIFLFRHHEDACNYLFDLARNPEKTRQTIGRLGTDFIGLELGEDGSVTRVISGEAKWRLSLTQSAVDTLMHGEWIKQDDGGKIRSGKGIWNAINKEPPVPVGLRQLQRLLQECDPDGYDAAILSMEKALLLRNPDHIPKTDLVVIVGNGSARRGRLDCLLPFEMMPAEYEAGNDLQLVEIVLEEGERIIDCLYHSLWNGDKENA